VSEHSSVEQNIRDILDAMEAARQRAGRPPGSVRLLAVTKTVEPERIRIAWDAGVRLFGESYVQEAVGKIDRLPPEAEWHFIGHLQSNKAKQALDLFHVIHSLDRPSLAEALEKAARSRGGQVDVLLEVNVGSESSKSGSSLEGAVELARRAPEWPSLRIRGLMAIPPYLAEPEEVRPYFRAVRKLAERIRTLGIPGVEMQELSMGMSHDFPVAVEEGATLVRVGTAIFGERP
jgi:pyridoxal phosphate enzyme (YggS family)